MNIEQKINYQLNKHPLAKKIIKRCYQLIMYTISPKIKSVGNIVKVSPNDNAEYFFGYYDKCPWDASGRYMLCMRADNTWSDPDPLCTADILLIDTFDNNKTHHIATTHTWNVQQGCMAQWLGPSYDKEIIYNDLRSGKYCAVILNVHTLQERILPYPIYTISPDGNTALSLDFSRLHRLRKGYGYAAIPETTANENLPDTTCIWKIDLKTGVVESLLKYTDFAHFEPRPEMLGAVHKVNHLMISPDGKRFIVLHRWFNGHRKYTRLVTCNIDGTEMYNLSDDDMVSHCYWKNSEEIIAFENKYKSGPGYYLMKDRTHDYLHIWKKINNDGHPSNSPIAQNIFVTDSYPNRFRIADIKILKYPATETESIEVIAKVFAPFKYDNDTRCDLHPRWSRDGKMICFDGAFEGHRGLYVIKNIQSFYNV